MSNMDSHPLIAKSIGALQRKLKGYLLFDDKYLKDRDGIHFFQQGEIYDVDYLYAAADKFADEFFSSIKDYKKHKTANVDHNKVETLEETIEEFKKDKIWLRRVKPNKREFQIVVALDDSSSMADNKSRVLALQVKRLQIQNKNVLELDVEKDAW